MLYIQVLVGVAFGIAVGFLFPDFGKALKPLGDGFIKLIKLIIAPIIFCTVTHGLAAMSDVKKLGRVGGKAILYFEVVSTLALVLGLIVVNVLRPGVGMNRDPTVLDAKVGQGFAAKAQTLTTTDFVLNIIPTSFFDTFAKGDLLQVLLVSILSAFAIWALGDKRQPILDWLRHGRLPDPEVIRNWTREERVVFYQSPAGRGTEQAHLRKQNERRAVRLP